MKKPDIEMLREIASKSTRVVAWYPHSTEVRGPYNRWFTCAGGDNYPQHVADIREDCEFAAAAMNNLVPLLDEVEALEKKVADLQLELILMGRHTEDAS